jgi:hypothetical protein
MTQTGPRSPEAKARVSTNAVRHGLRSTKVVIPGLEVQADWDQFFKDSVDALQPVGAIEYALVERITTLFWRLRRAARAERDAAILAGKLAGIANDPELDTAARIAAVLASYGFPSAEPDGPPAPRALQPPRAPAVLPVPLELQNLSRYEYRLSRQLLHAMHELQALQDRRQGNPAPLARLDVHGLPDDA